MTTQTIDIDSRNLSGQRLTLSGTEVAAGLRGAYASPGRLHA